MKYFFIISTLIYACYFIYDAIQFTRTNQIGYMLKMIVNLSLINFTVSAALFVVYGNFLKALAKVLGV